jgi:hypothetical protein
VRINNPPSPTFSTIETIPLLLLRHATTTPRGEGKRGYLRRSAAGSTIWISFHRES